MTSHSRKSKIAPGVCPGTQHTSPLIPIGGEPANYHGIPMVCPGIGGGGSQVQKMGVERHQVIFSQLILHIQNRGNILQYSFDFESEEWWEEFYHK